MQLKIANTIKDSKNKIKSDKILIKKILDKIVEKVKILKFY